MKIQKIWLSEVNKEGKRLARLRWAMPNRLQEKAGAFFSLEATSRKAFATQFLPCWPPRGNLLVNPPPAYQSEICEGCHPG